MSPLLLPAPKLHEAPDIAIIGQLGFLRTHDRLYVRLLAPGKPLGRKVFA